MNEPQYISQVFIKNFQSHEETLFDLSPGVNVLVGDSDAGKSAVFRALVWLMTNKPQGDEFRSHWGGKTEVSICLQPGDVWIGKVRDNKGMYYWVNDDTPENRLKGAGNKTDPPDEVAELLNMGTTNFQAQQTLPFLLSLTPNAAGKFFTDAADLNVIDRAIKAANSKIWHANDGLKRAKAELDALETKAMGFAWLDEAELALNGLEREQSIIDNLNDRHDNLASLCDKIDATREEIDTKAPILKAEGEVVACVQLQQEIDQGDQRREALAQLTTKVDNTWQALQLQMRVLDAEDEIKTCLAMVTDINNLANQQSSIQVAKVRVTDVQRRLTQAEKEYETAHAEFDSKFPDVCPLCGARQ